MRETGFEPVSPETVELKSTGITELTDSRNRCFIIWFFGKGGGGVGSGMEWYGVV